MSYSLKMLSYLYFCAHTFLFFCISLATNVNAAAESQIALSSPEKGYNKGDVVPVTCLNRTIETGEHITDSHGNLQYIPFLFCNETKAPLSFPYAQPQTVLCTIESLADEFYHLIEYFVHSDVPLSCRVPSYPLDPESALQTSSLPDANAATEAEQWTPLTIALQGKLQTSHLHLHTDMNVLFHTNIDPSKNKGKDEASRLIASTAYSVPNITSAARREGTKVIRNEPLTLTFNVGWIDGNVLPGMAGRPALGVKDHSVGFSLLSFFAVIGSAGVGALGMLVHERRKSGRGVYGNGILGGNVGNGTAVRSTGYGGYGGYSSGPGKRD